jgi:hypothetical protein
MKKVFLLLALAPLLSGCFGVKNVDVSIAAPRTVSIGQEFEVLLSITNTADEDQSLNSVDIENVYLEGIEVLGSDPEYYESFGIDMDNTVSYSYEINIRPGETLVVMFYCKAISAGKFEGKMDVCINTGFNYESVDVSTTVEALKEL